MLACHRLFHGHFFFFFSHLLIVTRFRRNCVLACISKSSRFPHHVRRSLVHLLEVVGYLLVYQLSFLDDLLRTFHAFLDRLHHGMARPQAQHLIREVVELFHVPGLQQLCQLLLIPDLLQLHGYLKFLPLFLKLRLRSVSDFLLEIFPVLRTFPALHPYHFLFDLVLEVLVRRDSYGLSLL